MALLRRVAEPLVELVLDVHLRKPRQDGGVPPASDEPGLMAARYVAWLAWRRVRRRQSGALVAALGLAVGAAVVACLLVGVTVATDRSTADAVARIPTDGRAFRAVWFGVPAGADESHATLDEKVRAALPALPASGPIRLALVRESTVAGSFVGLSAVDGLARFVQLRSGRLPRRCTPDRCEVLRLRGSGRIPNAAGLRLVEVGTATLRSRQLFGDFLEPTDNATADAEVAPAVSAAAHYHRPAPAPLVVAEGVGALASSPVLARTYRSYAWVWPLDRGSPRRWEIDDLIARGERGRAALAAQSSSFSVAGPVQELRAAQRTTSVAGRRLLLVGGEAAALLLAFAVLAARGMRRDLEESRRRLTWHGARRRQLTLLTLMESAAVAAAGVIVGWAIGSAAGAVLAAAAGEPTPQVLGQSILSPTGIAIGLLVVLLTTGLLVLAVSVHGRRGGVAALDLLAIAAVLVVAVALLGGVTDEKRLATSDSAGLVLLLLPGLLALAAAIASARLLPPLARVVAGRGRLPSRLAAAGLARGQGTMAATVAFLTLAFSLALLAEGYRATLTRAEHEQAAFRVPLEVTVHEDLSQLVPVFDAAPLGRFQRLAGDGGRAYPVVRLRGSIGRAEQVGGVTALGLDPGAFARLQLWRDEWAGASRDEAAQLVAPTGDVTLRSGQVPDGDLALGVGPSLLSFDAVLRLPGGGVRRVELGEARPRSATVLRVPVPPGARLASLELVPPKISELGADAGVALRGSVLLGGPLARELRGWVGVSGVDVRPATGGIELRYVITPLRSARVRPRQPTDGRPPAVLATQALADLAGGVGGLLPLQVGGEPVPVRVAGVLERFPGTTGDVVVGDRVTLQTAVEAAAPGAGRENEVWLDVAPSRRAAVEAALRRPPFRALAAESRWALEEDARRDPLARGTLVALAGTALAALLLAAIGLGLAVRSDLRDDNGELYDLEAQGASPSLLRRVVRSRAFAVSLAGLTAGALTGVLLVALVTRVVSVTARAVAPEPPLVTDVDPGVIAAGVALYGILTVVLVGHATRRAFAARRGPGERPLT